MDIFLSLPPFIKQSSFEVILRNDFVIGNELEWHPLLQYIAN